MPASDFESEAEKAAFKAGVKEATELVDEKKPLTVADIKKMSQEEIVDRMPEVRAALKGQPAGNTDADAGGDDGDGDDE